MPPPGGRVKGVRMCGERRREFTLTCLASSGCPMATSSFAVTLMVAEWPWCSYPGVPAPRWNKGEGGREGEKQQKEGGRDSLMIISLEQQLEAASGRWEPNRAPVGRGRTRGGRGVGFPKDVTSSESPAVAKWVIYAVGGVLFWTREELCVIQKLAYVNFVVKRDAVDVFALPAFQNSKIQVWQEPKKGHE